MFEPEEKELSYSDKGFNEVFVNFVGIEAVCSKCRLSFPLKSKLHTHIKSGCVKETLPFASPQPSSSIPVIVSKAVHTSLELGFSFRSWTYVTAAVTLAPEYLLQGSDPDSTACLDTGCGVTLVDKHWLLKCLPDQKISTMSIPLKVKGIGASKHESSEFAALSLYFPSRNAIRDLVYAALRCEIHLVEGLRANLLPGNDIMSPEAMVINLGKKTAIIGICGVSIDVNARQRGQFLAMKLLTNQDSVIPPRSEAMISLKKLPLPDNRDFFFHPAPQANLTLYSDIMDHKTSKILVKNASDLPLRVPRRHKLGHLLDMIYNNCFLIDTESAYSAAFVPPSSHPFSVLGAKPTLPPTNASMETVLENGIKVFGDADAVRQISDLVAEYPSIWETQGFVQIPSER